MKSLALAWLFCGVAWGQTPPETVEKTSEDAAETPEADAGESESASDSPPPPSSPPPSPPPENTEPQIKVIVTLSSGVQVAGTVGQSALFSWKPGAPIVFTPDGGSASELAGDAVTGLNTQSAAAAVQAGPEVTAPADPVTPVSDYTSPLGFAHPNPSASRYLYAPSSIPLKKGQGYVSQKLVFTSAAYAVADNFTVLYGAFTFFPPAMSVFGGKFAFKVDERIHLSFGGEAFVLGMVPEIPAAVGFGAVTFGHEDKHFTVASGYSNGSLFDAGAVPVMVAAQVRNAESVAFITENWVFLDLSETDGGINPDSFAVFLNSAAVRIIGRRNRIDGSPRGFKTSTGHPRTTWDIGLIAVGVQMQESYYDEVSGEYVDSELSDWDVFGPIPWVDWAWHFGPEGN